ncbi:hypothetical protein [Evansella tamaricis]|uniref:Uncharacterized protein n=1 Tax=Evansella tamaricis TaxID=2069301 RepID=A0ABS6JIT6_9BACI|nr:hypothetical protein [Evansella tamaricis]MBU9713501.1 hypothetical protein [Evansella tamaricis]
MQGVLKSSDIRRDFSEFVDSVVRDKPRAFTRNRDFILSLSKQHLMDLMANSNVHMEFEEDEYGFSGSLLENPELVAQGDTLEKLIEDMAYKLMDYAQLYYDEFMSLHNSIMRRIAVPIYLSLSMF